MKHLFVVFLFAFAAVLAGCAGPAPETTATSAGSADLYRAQVEGAAQRNGTSVLWANPPRRRSGPARAEAADEASLDVIRLRSRDDEDG